MNCEVRGEPFPPFVPSFPPFPTPRSLEENEPLSYLLRIIGLFFSVLLVQHQCLLPR